MYPLLQLINALRTHVGRPLLPFFCCKSSRPVLDCSSVYFDSTKCIRGTINLGLGEGGRVVLRLGSELSGPGRVHLYGIVLCSSQRECLEISGSRLYRCLMCSSENKRGYSRAKYTYVEATNAQSRQFRLRVRINIHSRTAPAFYIC